MTEVLRRGYPGMKSVKDLPVVQDGPPPGGFPSVRFGRRIPNTGPAGTTLFAVATAVIAYGFYQVGQTNHHRRALKAEKMLARTALVPVLQAEEDRRYVESKKHAVELEAKIMKNVPGWKAGESVYNTDKVWMAPYKPVGVWGTYNKYG